MPLTFFNWVLAFSPVIVVLGLMIGLNGGASRHSVSLCQIVLRSITARTAVFN